MAARQIFSLARHLKPSKELVYKHGEYFKRCLRVNNLQI